MTSLKNLSGLINRGNTCYINSSIQLLNAIDPFNKYVEDLCEKKNDGLEKNDEDHISDIPIQWNDLTSIMRRGSYKISPNKFINFILKLARQKDNELFTGGAQNDAFEFIIFFIDCLDECLIKEERNLYFTIRLNIFNNIDRMDKNFCNYFRSTFNGRYTFMNDLLYGYYKIKYIDTNTGEILRIRYESFDSLKLSLPNIETKMPQRPILPPINNLQLQQPININSPNMSMGNIMNQSMDKVAHREYVKKMLRHRQEVMRKYHDEIRRSIPTITLKDCINAHFEPEFMNKEKDNQYHYDVDNTYRDVSKNITLYHLPEYLLVDYVRWTYTGNKINLNITFDPDEILDLSNYIDIDMEYNINPCYELIGIINHSGISMGGHYTNYIKLKNKNNENIWFHIDDENIKRINKDEIVNPNNYIMLYRQVQHNIQSE